MAQFSRLVKYKGKFYTTLQLEKLSGVPHRKIVGRLGCGWTIDEALLKKFRHDYKKDKSPSKEDLKLKESFIGESIDQVL